MLTQIKFITLIAAVIITFGIKAFFLKTANVFLTFLISYLVVLFGIILIIHLEGIIMELKRKKKKK